MLGIGPDRLVVRQVRLRHVDLCLEVLVNVREHVRDFEVEHRLVHCGLRSNVFWKISSSWRQRENETGGNHLTVACIC